MNITINSGRISDIHFDVQKLQQDGGAVLLEFRSNKYKVSVQEGQLVVCRENQPSNFVKSIYEFIVHRVLEGTLMSRALRIQNHIKSELQNHIKSELQNHIKSELQNHIKPKLQISATTSSATRHNVLYLQLFFAIAKNDLNQAKTFLQQSSLKDLTSVEVYKLLELAIEHKNEQMMQLLLENGANPNVRSPDNTILLSRAVNSSTIEIALLLLKNGADDSSAIKELFGRAISEGRTDVVQLLINQGVDPNVCLRPDLYNAPIRKMLERENTAMIKVLLSCNNVTPVYGEILRQAALQGKIDIVKELLSPSENLVTERKPYAFTALCYAAEAGQKDIVEWFINQGFNVNPSAKDFGKDSHKNLPCGQHYSPLNAAIVSNKTEVVKLLLMHGAYPDRYSTKFVGGETPLHDAIQGKNDKIRKLILGALTFKCWKEQSLSPISLAYKKERNHCRGKKLKALGIAQCAIKLLELNSALIQTLSQEDQLRLAIAEERSNANAEVPGLQRICAAKVLSCMSSPKKALDLNIPVHLRSYTANPFFVEDT